jgi:hypothetical protein
MRESAMFIYVRNDEFPGILPGPLGMSLVFWSIRRVVARDLVLVGIQAGEKSREGRTAQGGRDVPPTEQGAFRSQLVEVRGLDVGMPHEAVIGVDLVVRKDQDDVGGLGVDRVFECTQKAK